MSWSTVSDGMGKYVKYRSLTDNSDSFPQHINLRNKESGWSHYAYSVKFAYADKKRYLCKMVMIPSCNYL